MNSTDVNGYMATGRTLCARQDILDYSTVALLLPGSAVLSPVRQGRPIATQNLTPIVTNFLNFLNNIDNFGLIPCSFGAPVKDFAHPKIPHKGGAYP